MKDTAMTDRPIKPYRIVLSEIRVYEIAISSDTDSCLEAWAREGWKNIEAFDSDTYAKLINRHLAEVTVYPGDKLPWEESIED